MNRILIEVGGTKVMLPAQDSAGTLLAALMAGVEVSSHGYGDDEKFTVNPRSTVSIRSVPESAFVSNEAEGLRIELAEAKASAASSNKQFYDQYNKTQALTKELAALKTPAQAA